MLKNIKKEFPYRFDAFAPQYDILAKEVPHDDYWELFTDQMLCSCGKRQSFNGWRDTGN